MSTNNINQLTPNFKTWDHGGHNLPNVEHSAGIRPAVNFKIAEWLPVQFKDNYFENWYTIMPGKPVALDNNGDLVPAQYGDGAADIEYTSDDVKAGVIDVETGEAVTAAKTVAASGVSTFLGASGVSLDVSKPIGCAPYGMLQWAGGDGVNPADFNQYNYNMQSGGAVVCDYMLALPLVPAKEEDESTSGWSEDSDVWTSDALSNLPVATNTQRTKIEFSGTDEDLFQTQLDDADKVSESGEWHIDYDTGVITVFKGDAGAPSVDVTYYHYASTPTSVSKFASVVGNPSPGDFLKVDTNGNFQVASGSDNFQDILAQVLEVQDFPHSGLDKVRTAWSPALKTGAAGTLPGYDGQLDQTAGSATGGVPSALHYAGAADKLVVLNLISR